MMAQGKVPPSAVVIDAITKTKQQARQRRKFLADAEQDEFERTRLSEAVKPTAATERKLRPDPIARLQAKQSITTAQAMAAMEIRDVFEGITSSMLARASTAERIAGGSGMPERLAVIHAQHYLPWAYYLGGVPHGAVSPRYFARVPKQGRCQVALETAIDIIVDGETIRGCEVKRDWRHGFGVELLRYALAVYAELAGWEQSRPLITAFEAEWAKSGGKPRPYQLSA